MRNESIPYERQMLPILRRFDHLTEENKKMHEQLAKAQAEVARLTELCERRKEKMDAIDTLIKDEIAKEGTMRPKYSTLENFELLMRIKETNR